MVRTPRIRPDALRNRLLVPAVAALLAGLGGVAFGLAHDDIVTALGALLFVPSALLLFGIVAKRREGGSLASSNRRTN
ncbi:MULTISPECIES: hypothetical protein [Halorubrum]|uniref:hypothetical protein n=1 Tax=Halorubrum TaxID=56688 RepID=UPI000F85417D|nr:MULTISPECIES: hypothetical protein [Halorubrum]AZQ15280.1 hypothetical protein DOS48_10800 [Halorubrum sp. PV6]